MMEFIDLKTQQERIRESLRKRIDAVLAHGHYIMGPEVSELEEKLAAYTGVKHCVSCANGTDAILMALMAYGIGPGDAVFTTPFTFIATAEVIALLGATPVFVDIDPVTFNIDPEKLSDTIKLVNSGKKPAPGMPGKLNPRAIITVDLFGLPADYDRINSVARENGLVVIEDGAQSFGAMYKGKRACSLADTGTTSFFPAKPLGCYGDGGAIFTNDSDIAGILRSIRVHGKGADKYDNIRIGINGRLDTLQAAVLLAKLEVFPDEVRKRQEAASRYTQALGDIVQTPFVPEEYLSVWAQYSVLSDKRSQFMAELKAQNIPTAIYYPIPLHLSGAFAYLKYPKDAFPNAESVSERVFSLPMHPYLENADQQKIVGFLAEQR